MTTAPKANAFRLIDNGERLAVHRVAIDDSGAVIAFDPEPVKLEVSADAGEAALWALQAMAFGAANSTCVMAPRLLLRDGKLIEIAVHGGDDAQIARVAHAVLEAA